MQINIVNFGYQDFRYFPMMELFLADAIKRRGGHEVKIYTVMNDENHAKMIARLKEDSDDFITIIWETLSSKSNSYIKKTIEFARQYKKMCNSPLLMGGYWASTVSRHFEEFEVFDYIIEGYSAERIADAIDHLNEKTDDRYINALEQIDWSKYDLNMDFLDNPSKYYNGASRFVSGYLSSIGCPNECTFCYNTVLRSKGTQYFERSIEKVKEDIEILGRAYDFEIIQFKDLNFFYNIDRATEILDFLKGRGKRIQFALDLAVKDSSEEIFKKISDYRIGEIWIGIESFNEKSRVKYNKEFTKEKLEKVFSWADKYRITLYGNIMLGAPWQDRRYVDDAISTALEYINKYRYVMIMFNSLRPIIGTPVQQEYYPDTIDDMSFNDTVDAFSFDLKEKQKKIYGDRFDFIDFQKVYNAFWYMNQIKIIENDPRARWKGILTFLRKKIEKQLTPPYFNTRCFQRLFLIKLPIKNKINALLSLIFIKRKPLDYWRYLKPRIVKR